MFTARLAQADSVTKTDFDTKLQDISKRMTSNKSKHLLVENELKKLQKFNSSYFRGKDRLEENYLVFKPMNKYFVQIYIMLKKCIQLILLQLQKDLV